LRELSGTVNGDGAAASCLLVSSAAKSLNNLEDPQKHNQIPKSLERLLIIDRHNSAKDDYSCHGDILVGTWQWVI